MNQISQLNISSLYAASAFIVVVTNRLFMLKTILSRY